MRKKGKEERPKLWKQVPGEKDQYGLTIPTPEERQNTIQKIKNMADRRREELAKEKKQNKNP